MELKKILITGANGYLGAQISRYLAQQGYSLSGLCFPQIPEDETWRQMFENLFVCDLRNIDELKAIAKHRFDAIVHLVSLDHHQSNGDPDFVTSVNITPTWSLLDIFSKNGLKKFLYFSTIHVYGKNMQGIVTENTPTKSANPYAMTHEISETICRYYAANSATNCVVARLSNSYGLPVFDNNNCWWLVVNDLCKMAAEKRHIELKSDGSPLRDFIHGSDVCQAVKILLEQGENGETYHISSGKTKSILDLAETVRAVFDMLFEISIRITVNKPDNEQRLNKPAHYTIDNSRLKQLGFFPYCSLEEGITELLSYFYKKYTY